MSTIEAIDQSERIRLLETALHNIVMKCDGSQQQSKRIMNIRERALAALEWRQRAPVLAPGQGKPSVSNLKKMLEMSSQEFEGVKQQRDDLLSAIKSARETLEFANSYPNGPINDTIWMMHGGPETLFDFMDAAIAKAEGKQ